MALQLLEPVSGPPETLSKIEPSRIMADWAAIPLTNAGVLIRCLGIKASRQTARMFLEDAKSMRRADLGC